ncbi:MAG: hypothetical protein LBK69_03755 [Syntrophomonadaceae bacterium]|jgi:hypothetical protein|nr:hypothetical protein [Syntrophomonadaceae bacterium]
MKNKFVFLGLIFVMFMIMGCFTTTSYTGNRQAAQHSNSQYRLLDPIDVVGKNLIGTDEIGAYSFLLNEDGNLEYTVNGTVNTGNWTFDKSAEMYRYTFNWTEDGKQQGYIMDFLDNGAEIIIAGHWYLTDDFITFGKKATIEE